jgi:D-alanyl-lipoteichoic acid acyltransferase DltB (MBOAT superfamily)
MILYSWTFLILFLPLVLIGFHGFIRIGYVRTAVTFVVAASVWFIGVHDLRDAALFVSATMVNFAMATWLHVQPVKRRRQYIVGLAVAANLGLLAYFKYVSFLWELLHVGRAAIPSGSWSPSFLPIGLSFFAFQQIAFLVDCARDPGTQPRPRLSDYVLFSLFFPKQVAGPIVRGHEFFGPPIERWSKGIPAIDVIEGFARVVVGYIEKVLVGDSLALYASPVFEAAAVGEPVGFVAAWGGVLAYTFQLYFDFVGYTDMALGLARMLGVRLPENFNAPYRAASVMDFWRRWHMSLSRFLRDYVYIPLGGSRHGRTRQLINLLVTMMLGGLWHGAGWTFLMWGTLHGMYLAMNHVWRAAAWPCPRWLGWGGTFMAVTYAWVWFRADNIPAAWRLTEALLGLNGWWATNMRGAIQAFVTPSPRYAALAAFLQDLQVAVSVDRWTVYPGNLLLSSAWLQGCWLAIAAWWVWRQPVPLEWKGTTPPLSWDTRHGAVLACLFFVAIVLSLQETTRSFVYSRF